MPSPPADSGEPRIFLSYRRADTEVYADRLYDWLGRIFDPGSVFMDIDTLRPGDDFIATIDETLEGADVLLVLIGPGWASAERGGRRRLDDPDDYVRNEVSRALASPFVAVIPVLVGQAQMPRGDELPADLQALGRLHASELTRRGWRTDLEGLEASVREATTRVRTQRASVERERVRREAEERSRREAEAREQRESERALLEAERDARRQVEAEARRQAAENARRRAQESARVEAERRARQAAEDRAARDADQSARRAAEEQRATHLAGGAAGLAGLVASTRGRLALLGLVVAVVVGAIVAVSLTVGGGTPGADPPASADGTTAATGGAGAITTAGGAPSRATADEYTNDVTTASEALTAFGGRLQTVETPDALEASLPDLYRELRRFDVALFAMSGYELEAPVLERQRAAIVVSGRNARDALTAFTAAVESGDPEAVDATLPRVTEALARFENSAKAAG